MTTRVAKREGGVGGASGMGLPIAEAGGGVLCA